MKAVVFKGPFDVQVENVPDARVETPTDAVVRTTTTNICGSDLHMYEGRAGVERGKILGHENTGIVQEVGPAVTRIKAGDRVSVPFNVACGKCRNCVEGWTSYCLLTNPEDNMDGAAYGYANMGPYDGGQAEYLRVPDADFNLLELPPGDEHELDFAMLSDIFPTGWHGTELAGIRCAPPVASASSASTCPRTPVPSPTAPRTAASPSTTAAASARASTWAPGSARSNATTASCAT